MSLKLIIQLIFGVFSFKRNSMRFFNGRRLLMAVLFFPFFFIQLFINQICLGIDYLFFFGFRKMKVEKVVFIVALPRSATTYLHVTLTKETHRFTTFKRWEMIFAPSIIQKYWFLGLNAIDSLIGSPLKHFAIWIEAKMIPRFGAIHHGSLNKPEEDETLFLWNMSSVYLNFLYPETEALDAYYLFDREVPTAKRKRIFAYYYRCVQRHQYVFNRSEEKYFLAKNPSMMPKLLTISEFFPKAHLININRCVSKSIPSSIALMDLLYSMFTSKQPPSYLHAKTKGVLIEWCKMAHQHLPLFGDRVLRLSFDNLVSNEPDTIQTICNRFDLKPEIFDTAKKEADQDPMVKGKNKYEVLSQDELETILEEIPFMKPYCTDTSGNKKQRA